MGIRISAKHGLTGRRFRNGPIAVDEGRWDDVDPSDKAVRRELVQFVGTHVIVYPEDVPKLGEYNLALRGNRLVNLEAATEAPAAAPAAVPSSPKGGRARAG